MASEDVVIDLEEVRELLLIVDFTRVFEHTRIQQMNHCCLMVNNNRLPTNTSSLTLLS